jgi:hypothetical protein
VAGVGVTKEQGNILFTKFGYWTWEQENKNGTKGEGRDAYYRSKMKITFTPNPKTVNSNEISFVQIMKTVTTATGKNADVRPLCVGRMTAKYWNVDHVENMKFGWYLYDNNGIDSDYGNNGKTTPLVPAVLKDTAGWNQPGLTWEYQTFAIAKNGQGGQVLSGLSWGFTVDGKLVVTSTPPKLVTNFQDFKDAVKKWNDQAGGKVKNHKDQVLFGDFTFPN